MRSFKLYKCLSMNQSTKDLTKTILILAGISILVPALAVSPGLGYLLKPFLKHKDYYPSEIERTVHRLHKQKLISYDERGGKIKITLTKDGKRKVLSYKIEEMKLKKGKWDGWWRVIVFDIPEKKKKARDILRDKMKEIGFYQLQRSVLVTPWECENEIDFIKNLYGIEGEDICLIKAKKFDGEDYVRNYFDL